MDVYEELKKNCKKNRGGGDGKIFRIIKIIKRGMRYGKILRIIKIIKRGGSVGALG